MPFLHDPQRLGDLHVTILYNDVGQNLTNQQSDENEFGIGLLVSWLLALGFVIGICWAIYYRMASSRRSH